MITRLRYQRKDEITLVTNELLGTEFTVRAEIDESTKSYKIVTKDNAILNYGAAKSLNEVKKLVKINLRSLGVRFLEEVRTKGEIKNG